MNSNQFFTLSVDSGDSVYEILNTDGKMKPKMGNTFQRVITIPVEQLSDYVQKYTHSFAEYKNNTRTNLNCTSLNGFVVDIDNGTSIAEFLETTIAKQYNFFLYTSRHHQHTYTKIVKGVEEVQHAHDKFHVMFSFDQQSSETTIERQAAYTFFVDALNDLFSINADVNVKDAARLIYPSRLSGCDVDANYKDILSFDKRNITVADINGYAEQLKSKHKINKAVKETYKDKEYSQGDTLENVEAAIRVLATVADYNAFFIAGMALANVLGEEGRDLFLIFASNPNYNDTEEELSKQYDQLLRSVRYNHDVQKQVRLGSIIHLARQHNFVPTYSERSFETCDMVADLLGLDSKLLKSRIEDELKLLYCDGEKVTVKKIQNGTEYKPSVLLREKAGNEKIQQCSEYFKEPVAPFVELSVSGINSTNLYKKIIESGDFNSSDVEEAMFQCSETKYLNNPWDLKDPCRNPSTMYQKLVLLKKNPIPTFDINNTPVEEILEKSKTFQNIITELYGNGDMPAEVIFKYLAQTLLENRSASGMAIPILLLQSERGAGKTLFYDFLDKWFGGKGENSPDINASFNSFWLAPIVFFDETEGNRAALNKQLKAITGNKNTNIKHKYGKEGRENISPAIVIASNRRPIAITDKVDNPDNNAYLYLNLDTIPGDPDERIKSIVKKYCQVGKDISSTLYELAPYWVWVDGLKLFSQIAKDRREKGGMRYGFTIPLTDSFNQVQDASLSKNDQQIAEVIKWAMNVDMDTISFGPIEELRLFKFLINRSEPCIATKNLFTILTSSAKGSVAGTITEESLKKFLETSRLVEKGTYGKKNVKYNSKVVSATQFNKSKFISLFTDEVVEQLEEAPELISEPIKVVSQPVSLFTEPKPEPQIASPVVQPVIVVQTSTPVVKQAAMTVPATVDLSTLAKTVVPGARLKIARENESEISFDKDTEVMFRISAYGFSKYYVLSIDESKNVYNYTVNAAATVSQCN